ncbi:MAG: sugar phosphate isomerase/epimerase family protein [Verrucomicrobiota bacterium]
MIEWPVALSTGCFYWCGIFDVLEPIRAAGFCEIEVCSFPTHLDYHNREAICRAGERLRALQIHPTSFHAPFANHIDITALDPCVREASVAELILACEAAAQLGCDHVVLHPGPEREGRPPDAQFIQHMHHAADALNRVAARCGQLDIQLLLENMLGHLMFGHVRDMMYLLGEINTGEVGTCLDTGHAHLAREMATVIKKLSGYLKMVHINDNQGDRDSHLPPGNGSIDWRWVMGELRRCDFHGVLVLELSGSDQESIGTILARATGARDYLNAL